MPLSCGSLFCLYNDDERCLLKYPRLDISGACMSKIFPEFDMAYINKMKDEYIEKINKQQKGERFIID